MSLPFPTIHLRSPSLPSLSSHANGHSQMPASTQQQSRGPTPAASQSWNSAMTPVDQMQSNQLDFHQFETLARSQQQQHLQQRQQQVPSHQSPTTPSEAQRSQAQDLARQQLYNQEVRRQQEAQMQQVAYYNSLVTSGGTGFQLQRPRNQQPQPQQSYYPPSADLYPHFQSGQDAGYLPGMEQDRFLAEAVSTPPLSSE